MTNLIESTQAGHTSFSFVKYPNIKEVNEDWQDVAIFLAKEIKLL